MDRDEIVRELRAILAPLLAKPFRGGREEAWCVFCDVLEGDPHDANCPVLRRNEILGEKSGA